MDDKDEMLDLVVIGAGWAGLSASKTYHQIHPTSTLLVLDAQDSIGGTWAKSRLYPTLKSNNLYGINFQFPDFPMGREYGVREGEHIPGGVVCEYLTRYAKHFGIYPHVRFNTTVVSLAEMAVPSSSPSASSSTWKLTVQTLGQTSQVRTKRLIIATGLTNTPLLPSLPNAPAFAGPIVHTKALAASYSALTAPNVKDVVVLGGSKSSVDGAYMLASAGVTAHLVIRASGNGPAWLAKSYATPLQTPLETLLMRRVTTLFGLPLWDDTSVGYTWLRRLLHKTAAGRALVDAFFAIIKSDMIAGMGLADHPETKKLIPSVDPFFTATSLGIDNYQEDIREMVREGRITLHMADVARLEASTVRLSNGEEIPADAIVCATGWVEKPTFELEAPLTPKALGMPYYAESESVEKDPLIARADNEVFARFPKLRSQPTQSPRASHNVISDPSFHPFLLYKGMVPPAYLQKRNLAYAGFVACIAGPTMWHVQALWITAFLDGELLVPEQREVEYETVLYSRWSRWRGPLGQGGKHLETVFEALPYLDMLMRQLGLDGWRKGGWREMVEAYGSGDYANVVEEWMSMRVSK